MSNGFVCIVAAPGKITVASADHSGQGNYGANTLASGGVVLERESGDGSVLTSASLTGADVLITANNATESSVGVTMAGVTDGPAATASASEDWEFALEAGGRSFSFVRTGRVTLAPGAEVADVRALRRTWNWAPSSVTGWYDEPTAASRGRKKSDPSSVGDGAGSVVQMKAGPPGADFFPSVAPLNRVYSLGGGGEELGQVGNMSIDLRFFTDAGSGPAATVLMSSEAASPYFSGFQEVLLAGAVRDYVANGDPWLEHWGGGWDGVSATALSGGDANPAWSSVVEVGVNDVDFPVLALLPGEASDMPFTDLQSVLIGIYASPVGCLMTHRDAIRDGVSVGQIATTIARPDRGYSDTFNYFDPDNYISTASMLWSGERFLMEQVRLVVERSGAFLTAEGQLPHHFSGVTPVYQALSGEIQTGPNVFWILSCLNYAKSSGNFGWLRDYFPTLRKASMFLFGLIDYDVGMANVSGSLMIDVFLRSNFTADTNAMLVGFLRDFAGAER